MNRRMTYLVIGCLSLLVGCHDVSPAWQGRMMGGLLGGVVGSELSGGSAAGAVAGSMLGSLVGEDLAVRVSAQHQKVSQTLETSRSGVATAWRDPDAEVRYVLVPESATRAGREICRPFKLIVESQDGREVLTGVACRQGKSRWVVKH